MLKVTEISSHNSLMHFFVDLYMKSTELHFLQYGQHSSVTYPPCMADYDRAIIDGCSKPCQLRHK